MSGLPTVTVEVDVTNNPRSGASTWTDITSYVRSSVTMTQGRQDFTGEALQPGTATFTLNNNDKRFTPSYTGGPYGSGFRKGIQVRISETFNSVTYRRFTGYIDSVAGPRWPNGTSQDCVVEVTCTDELSSWHSGRVLHDHMTETILADNPDAYYPLSHRGHKSDGGDHRRFKWLRNAKGFRDPELDTEFFEPTYDPKVTRFFKRGHFFSPNLTDHADNAFNQTSLTETRVRGGATCFWTSDRGEWPGGSAYFNRDNNTDSNGATFYRQQINTTASSKYVLECWVKCDRAEEVALTSASGGGGGSMTYNDGKTNNPTYAGHFLTLETTSGARYLTLAQSSQGELLVKQDDGTSATTITGPTIRHKGWNHVLVYYDRSGNTELYVNGVTRADNAWIKTAKNWDNSSANPTLTVGMHGSSWDSIYAPFTTHVAHVAVYTGTSATDAKTNRDDHYRAGLDAYDGARTGAMFTRLLNWTGWPGSSSVENGATHCGPHSFRGLTALEYAELLCASEQGWVFVKGDGTMTFHGRHHRFKNTSATLSISAPTTGTEFATDPEWLVNKVRVVRANGHVVKVRDQTSVDTYGPETLEVSTVIKSEDAAQHIGKLILQRRKDATPRLSTVPVDLLTEPSTSQVANALSTVISDRVSVTGLPSQAYTSTVTGFVEGWTETVSIRGAQVWRIEFYTSPTFTSTTDAVLDDATYGVLDTATLSY